MGAVPGVVRYSAGAIVDAVIPPSTSSEAVTTFANPKSRILASSFGNEYVGRLDISVSDSRRVGCIERVRNLNP